MDPHLRGDDMERTGMTEITRERVYEKKRAVMGNGDDIETEVN